MDNLMSTESEMFCPRFSFLFINDANQAFTPVLEMEITGLNLKQAHDKEDDRTNQELKLH